VSSKSPITSETLKKLDGSLIVSCQASLGEPLCHSHHIIALALSAVAGGAKGLRLEGIENIAQARHNHELPKEIPIIGLVKAEAVPLDQRLKRAYITVSFADARAIALAGADIVALDATGRPRADELSLEETIERIHVELQKPVWADTATLAQGIAAAEAGADIVATTLFGYTEETVQSHENEPGFDLLASLVKHLSVPVVLEGKVWHPDEVHKAFDLGAYAVVVGSAITRPQLITERFVKAIPAPAERGAARSNAGRGDASPLTRGGGKGTAAEGAHET
jgi:N-acylglucosamine-6-phosphate 2-epimerase